MKYNCYVKGCEEDARHNMRLEDLCIYVCNDHYDDAVVIFNDAQDRILGEERDAKKKVRDLGVKDG